MPHAVKSITLAMPFGLGSVNCYLIDTGAGFILIDTGSPNARGVLERELDSAGCQPGSLRLIIITHGDFDHTGNAAYLRQKFGAKIAMHRGDLGMAERGDMFWNRKSGSALVRVLAPVILRFGKDKRFTPDLFLEDGDALAEHGLDATVLSIPGHSSGSIGILTASGDLFCGDLLENTDKPALSSIMDDPLTARASVDRLKGFAIHTVYPGHGTPFPMAQFMQSSG